MVGYNCIMVYSPDKAKILMCKRVKDPFLGLYNLVGGHPFLYPLIVIALFLIYIAVFYAIYHLATKKKEKQTVSEKELQLTP